jgi:hypothetical protein
VAAGRLANNSADEILSIAKEHQRFVHVIERIFNSREARALPRLITITVRALSSRSPANFEGWRRSPP